ncbi:MAG: hypothetical protein U0414_09785 [Polyangiaceae bacterium]
MSLLRALRWAVASAVGLCTPACSLIDLSSLDAGTGGGATGSASTSASSVTASTSTSGASMDPCASVTCSMHGVCEDHAGAPTCVCDGHFDGADCGVCSAPYMGADCLACAAGYQDKNDDGTCAPACQPSTCSVHGACDDASGEARCVCAFGWSGPDCATACAPGTAGPGCAYEIVYGLDVPTAADWNAPADVPYDIDNATQAGAYTRVAYRLVLDDQDVWVEMDAFTANAALLGVPTTWTWDIPISNVLVASSAPNQPSITSPATGALEFWADCYTPGADGSYDTDDDPGGGAACYGSMQVHVGSSTAIGFNSWSNGGTIDIGIGSATTGEPDWTFHGNAFAFTKRRLEVYVRP